MSFFRERIEPFISTADKGQKILIRIGPFTYRLRKRTRRNGHFRGRVKLSDRQLAELREAGEIEGDRLRVQAAVSEAPDRWVEGSIFLTRTNGVSVVSDIDDTIKVTGVGNRRELLANTFLREFQSIEGMPQLYRQWSEAGADFHYVSSSPWQLFGPLVKLQVDAGFPAGSVHLRRFRLRDQLARRVNARRRKSSVIRQIVKIFPERKFVLIGDSGERDPEIYRKICLKYPDRVLGLFIRHVENNPMEADRYLKIKSSIPSTVCATFSTAEELAELSAEIPVLLGVPPCENAVDASS